MSFPSQVFGHVTVHKQNMYLQILKWPHNQKSLRGFYAHVVRTFPFARSCFKIVLFKIEYTLV